MELWFTELNLSDLNNIRDMGLTYKVKRVLYSGKSNYQQMDILDTYRCGRMLILDGYVMTTEMDEFVYHEMIAHVPLFCHPYPRRALVIGGGDGGAVREILKHPSIDRIDLVEIDPLVVEKSREFLPKLSCGLDDPRVNIHYMDGIKFVKEVEEPYNVIVVDSSDPVGPAVGLFQEEFYRSCFQILTDDGILSTQSECPFCDHAIFKQIYSSLGRVFPIVWTYFAPVLTYPGGYWSFAFASPSRDPIRDLDEERFAHMELKTRYYNTEVHRASFALPNFVRKLLKEAGINR